ncbi:MAG: TrmH family RNA methyltransferase [Parcubacteria group bacterium]|nr:TrmH family RNA methyltransferase [Parcubacteria group bacterium]
MKESFEVIVVLHNIRSAHNVGAIFRTADAAGVKKIYLTGYTPTPVDRFGRKDDKIAKTALGAEALPWKSTKNAISLLRRLKKEGYFIVAVEQSPNSVDYKKIHPRKKTAFVFGNEVRGLSETILSSADGIAEVRMHGTKESLNVAVTAGIVLFRTLNI